MQTTLNKIKLHDPCEGFWNKLLNHLGKTEADDEVLELRTILESNGVEDTLWVLKAVDGKDKEIRLFAADCAELVLPIFEKQFPNDDRPRKTIQAARDYANGLISVHELAAAKLAAAKSANTTWNVESSAARAAEVTAEFYAAKAAWDAESYARVANHAWNSESFAASNEIKSLLLKYI